jgi:hypothetical protein
MNENLPSSFMGYFLGASNSPYSQGLKLNVNVGFRLPQLPKRFQVEIRLWTHVKLDMMINLWEDKH